MNKILTTREAIEVSKELREQHKKIVLAGGCFDILHRGHIEFLNKAKEQGDILMLLLESDETITRTKGQGRPINTQEDRAAILASLEMVDYVIMLDASLQDTDYDRLIVDIHPDILATTQGDKNRVHKERQAKLTQGKVVDVIMPVMNQSTTRIISILEEL